ncbi:MAG: hypothetical protein IJ109_05185 [Firmicutes bacterium]|nr:hypothetical protein [Bacillota bacterium]
MNTRSATPIRCGIRKVNIATASFMSTMEHAKAYLNGDGPAFASGAPNYFGMSEAMVQGTCENVKHHIRVFRMEKV